MCISYLALRAHATKAAHRAPALGAGLRQRPLSILYYTILYYAMLCYAMLYYAVLTIPYYNILYYTRLYYPRL